MVDYGYARPGELILGNDSHSVGYGCLNAASTGVSGSGIKIIYASTFGELWFEVPKSIKSLSTVITRIIRSRRTSFFISPAPTATTSNRHVHRIHRPADSQMPIESRMCISTQGVDVGATFALFPCDNKTRAWLAPRTDKPYEPLTADPDAEDEKEIHLETSARCLLSAAKRGHSLGTNARRQVRERRLSRRRSAPAPARATRRGHRDV